MSFDTLRATLDRAVSPLTPVRGLVELAVSLGWGGRSFAARNPSLPVETVRRLAEDLSPLVRMAVVDNPVLPVDELLDLTRDKHKGVKYAALRAFRERSERGEL